MAESSLPPPERWKPVPDWEGYYEVSDHGRVRGLDRTITTRTGYRKLIRGRVLAGIRHIVNRTTGPTCIFVAVNLKRDGHSRTVPVHQLVMAAFVGPRPPDREVCHANGNAEDNRLTNLSYGTASDNALDRVRHGVHRQARKTHCPLGHELATPNLVAGSARRGSRACLACNRARAYGYTVRRAGGSYDVAAGAHEYYAQLMPTPAVEARS